jgi:hypothetical protein
MAKKKTRLSKRADKGSVTIQWVERQSDTAGNTESKPADQAIQVGPKGHKQMRRGRAPRVRLIG